MKKIELAENIYSSTAIHNDNHREKILKVKDVCLKFKDIAPNYFEYFEPLKIVIRPIKGHTLAEYLFYSNEIHITSKITAKKEIIKNLCHEYTHANQYYAGNLKVSYNIKYENYDFIWNSNTYSYPYVNKNYPDLPWEIQADQTGNLALYIYNEYFKK